MKRHVFQFMQEHLDALQERSLYRQLQPVSAGAASWVRLDGRRVLNLSSNNYLGLATRPELKAAAILAANADGCGSGSSRLIVGSSERHQALEAGLARFKESESALLFNSGYVANVGVISSLVEAGDLILSDELNHASIIDGCRLSKAERAIYPHCDLNALEKHLASAIRSGHKGKRVVVTDTIFSMDGDSAPLAEIVSICRRYDAILVIDEAHATGCMGPGGRGLAAQAGVEYEALISIGTLSKAMGSFGAFMVGPALLKEFLINVSRNFIFTTALPAPTIAASMAALDILQREPQLIHRLQENATFFREGLQKRGFNTLISSTHIVPVLVSDAALAMEMTRELLQEGIFAVAIRPPTVPPGSARIRTSLMATHSRVDLSHALDVFERVGRNLGVL